MYGANKGELAKIEINGGDTLSDELAKLSLKDLIAQGKLGQLDLKRKKGRLPCPCEAIEHEKPKEVEILRDKEEILREKEAKTKLKQEERLRDKEERKKLFQEQRARKEEERIRKREEKARRLAILEAPKPPKKGYRIRPLTIDEERDCDRLMGLYGEDISLIARILRVNPIVIQAYWLNKSKEKKVK